jgi:hypothetical protein
MVFNRVNGKCQITGFAVAIFILSLMLSVISLFAYSLAGPVHYPPSLSQTFSLVSISVCAFSLLFAVLGIAIIKLSHKSSNHIPFLSKLSIGVTILIFFLAISERSWINKRSIAVWSPGSSNMNRIVRAMLTYANDHKDHMPDPNHWCDILLDQGYIGLENLCMPSVGIKWPFGSSWPLGLGNWPPEEGANINFDPGSVIVFPSPRKGHCDFAMNSNCRYLPGDGETVILFASEPGWNKSGGSELAKMDRFGNEGTLVYRMSEGTTFIRKEHISDLSWEGY